MKVQQNVSPQTLLPQELTLSDEQFKTIANFMESYTGIKMPISKRLMIQSRLQTRLKALKLPNFSEYIKYVFSSDVAASTEIVTMVDVLTTNLTHFFREKPHFDFMQETVLPYFVKNGVDKLQIWSAGCSSGEEPYTLSIVMKEFMRKNPGKFLDYEILATDISIRMLEKAFQGIYPLDSIEKLSLDMKKRYFLRGTSIETPRTRVKDEVRRHVKFERLNLMDSVYNVNGLKHVIFCRNVLIYFDKPTQLAVVSKFVRNLQKGGFLFLGHSETIFGMNLPLKTVAPTVFQKIEN